MREGYTACKCMSAPDDVSVSSCMLRTSAQGRESERSLKRPLYIIYQAQRERVLVKIEEVEEAARGLRHFQDSSCSCPAGKSALAAFISN